MNILNKFSSIQLWELLLAVVVIVIISMLIEPIYGVGKDFGYEIGMLLKSIL
ncbi:hypothetical protein HPA30_10450 [Streptococcus suis]|nr:hypothetical protein [Streptococcus suis]